MKSFVIAELAVEQSFPIIVWWKLWDLLCSMRSRAGSSWGSYKVSQPLNAADGMMM